jgi:hypothetical protein
MMEGIVPEERWEIIHALAISMCLDVEEVSNEIADPESGRYGRCGRASGD